LTAFFFYFINLLSCYLWYLLEGAKDDHSLDHQLNFFQWLIFYCVDRWLSSIWLTYCEWPIYYDLTSEWAFPPLSCNVQHLLTPLAWREANQITICADWFLFLLVTGLTDKTDVLLKRWSSFICWLSTEIISQFNTSPKGFDSSSILS
jgi:hypothetical protein